MEGDTIGVMVKSTKRLKTEFVVDKNIRGGVISFSHVLTMILVVAKLANLVSLGWVWVFSPMWSPFVLLAILCCILFYLDRDKLIEIISRSLRMCRKRSRRR
jgi:hypothetical protein